MVKDLKSTAKIDFYEQTSWKTSWWRGGGERGERERGDRGERGEEGEGGGEGDKLLGSFGVVVGELPEGEVKRQVYEVHFSKGSHLFLFVWIFFLLF